MPPINGVSVGLSSFAVLITILLNHFFLKDKIDIDTISSPDSVYDYIVVGAGAAGGPLASRLATLSDNTVLLIEAGPVPSEHSRIPFLSTYLLKSEVDWGFLTEPHQHALRGYYNKQAAYAGGRTLGGGAGMNNMAYYWPKFRDMDTWAELVNDNRWRSDNLARYYQDIEDTVNVANRTNIRGIGGPVSISSLPCDDYAECPAFLEAARYRDYPVLDINGGHEFGFMPAQRSIKNGKRFNVVDGFLLPALRECKNRFNILTDSFVEKIQIEEHRATGVTIRLKNNNRITVRARKEVIVSAGATLSPKLLQLSGIGPREWLNKFKIPVIQDLPVGKNFVDQIYYNVFYRLDPSRVPPSSGVWNPDVWKSYFENNNAGPLGNSGHRVVGRLPLPSGRPGQVLIVLRAAGDGDPRFDSYLTNKKLEESELLIPDAGNASVPKLILQVMLQQPKSRGTIQLRSIDPADPPRIDPNVLADEDDITDMVDSIRVGQHLMTAPSMKALGAQIHVPDVAECRTPSNWLSSLDSDDYWRCLVRYYATVSYHPASTCKMGDRNDPGTVVDSRFRVLGIDGLRVVDASVLPRHVSGNPHGPMMGLGNFAAHSILEDDRKKSDWKDF